MAEAKEGHILDDDKPAITTVADKLEEVMRLIEEEKEEEVQQILQSHTGLLHRACDIGWIEAVKYLLDRKVPLNQWNEAHLHPLHLAVRNNHIEIVKILLGYDPNIIDRPSNFGETPLHFACLKGHTPLVKLLLDSKADVRLDDRCGNTALHYAVSSNNPELVEYLLRDKNLLEFINKKNEFHHSPIHRAAVLQCVEVIEVLSSYRVKFNIKDKNGLTPHQLATILYDNKRTTTPINNKGSKGDTIIVPTKRIPSPLSFNYDHHSRSSSFSYHRPSQYSMDGSTTSLPVSDSGSIPKKRPSATKANRPVNLSFAQSYSRQTSGGSSRGSRSSEIYLKDKEQAEKLSEVLDKQGSLDHLEEIVLNQTSYEPPIDMSFVPPVESFTLTHDSSRFASKDHDVKIKISESYWRLDSHETLDCKMAASLHWTGAYPSDYVFVSPICFFSCRSKRACEVKLTLPHALHFPSEKQHKRITIYFTHTVNLQETAISSPSLKEFRRLATSDLNIDTHYVSFTTTVKYPSLFTVAVAMPPPTINKSLPILPMRCFLYIASPSEKEQYVTNTDILMYVAMNLKTVEMAMKKFVLPDNFVLEEKGFVMTGPMLRVHGISENEQYWQITRRGSGIFRYNQVALSQEIETESYMTHQQSYPLKESLFVECNNASKVLKCRISLECEGNELINMLITPYIPIKQYPTLDPFKLRESINSPHDMNSVSSSESIPLRTSSV